MCRKFICLTSFVVLLGLISNTSGALTLVNAGFDAQTIAEGSWTNNSATGWTCGGPTGASAGAQHLSSGALTPPAQDGHNNAYLNQGGWMYQVPQDEGSNVTIQPNQTYKVSVWVGRRSGNEGNYGGILQVSLPHSQNCFQSSWLLEEVE